MFCFRSNKMLQLEQKGSTGYYFYFIHLFFPSASILFVVSCQAPLIYLCIKWCNYLYSLFVKPEESQLVGTGLCWQCCCWSFPQLRHRQSFIFWVCSKYCCTFTVLTSRHCIPFLPQKYCAQCSLNQLENANN